jgi:hypothetical protein
VAVYDYDADGRPDLFVGARSVPGRYPEAAQSRVLHHLGGRFEDVTAAVCPDMQKAGMIAALRFGDLDGDGRPEMITAGDWSAVRVYRWNGRQWVAEKEVTPPGWWRCLTLSDLDGDGDLDILAGNWGLNTRFRASEQAPMRLFAADYDKNGSLDPLLCTPWEGAYYPVVQRDMLATQLPVVKKKYPRHTPYAGAKVQDIFSEQELLGGRVLEAGMLETVWLENRNGSFVVRSLPAEVQMSPVQCLLETDVNEDGKRDVLLFGNEWGADPETGRLDASYGLVLAGDGRGNFQVVLPGQTGLMAEGVVRDALLMPLATGKNVLILGINNAPIRAFWAKMKGGAAVPSQN